MSIAGRLILMSAAMLVATLLVAGTALSSPEAGAPKTAHQRGQAGPSGNIVNTAPEGTVPEGAEVVRTTVTDMTYDGKVRAVHTEILREDRPDPWTEVDESQVADLRNACPSGRRKVTKTYTGRGMTGVYYRFNHSKTWSYRGCRIRSVSTNTYPSDMRFNASYEGLARSLGGYRDNRTRHWSKRVGHFRVQFVVAVNQYPYVAINARANGTWSGSAGI
jgi:hypothetical protein